MTGIERHWAEEEAAAGAALHEMIQKIMLENDREMRECSGFWDAKVEDIVEGEKRTLPSPLGIRTRSAAKAKRKRV